MVGENGANGENGAKRRKGDDGAWSASSWLQAVRYIYQLRKLDIFRLLQSLLQLVEKRLVVITALRCIVCKPFLAATTGNELKAYSFV